MVNTKMSKVVRKDKLIRKVDDGIWNRAKAMAQREGKKIRQLIEEVLLEYTIKKEKELAEEVNQRP